MEQGPRTASPALAVWDEFGSGQGPGLGQLAGGRRSSSHRAGQHPFTEPAPTQTGSPASRAWLTALARHCEGTQGAQAKAELTELLHCGARSRSKVVQVSNQARQQIGQVYSWVHQADDALSDNTAQRARQCQYLYERVLHGVLLGALEAAAAACGGGTLSQEERHQVVEQAVGEQDLQLGIINACVEVVNFAYLRSPQEAFPWATLQMGRMHHAVELWQACYWLVEHMTEAPPEAQGSVPGIPEEVVEYLAAIQVRVEEELAFIDNSNMYRRIVAAGTAATSGGSPAGGSTAGHGRGPGRRRKYAGRPGCDEALVACFFENLGRTAMLRTHSVCQELLAEFPSLQAVCPELPARACVIMDLLCFEHCDLLFGQHLSVCLACAIYFTVRLHGNVLPFRKITGLMAEVLPNHSEATFSHVELPLDDAAWDCSREHGDARAFYNRVFLPPFGDYDASQLFGEALLPTPAKPQLEAPDPASRGGAGPTHQLQTAPKPVRQAAGGVDAAGPKLRQPRRPLAKVSTNSGGAAASAR